MGLLQGTLDDETFGLSTSDLPPDTYSGAIGDGSKETGDWFTDLLNSDAASKAASAGVTALFGGNKVIDTGTTGGGGAIKVPSSQQGGAIGEQSQTKPWYSSVPMVGWIIAGALLIFGAVAVSFGRR